MPTTTEHDNANDRTFLRRVSIRNYKSIRQCDVWLGEVTTLVGRNGSGKSNFLDALRFVADSLEVSLEHAVKTRGGVNEIRFRAGGESLPVVIALELTLRNRVTAEYRLELSEDVDPGYFVVDSESLVMKNDAGETLVEYGGYGGCTIGPVGSRRQESTSGPNDRLYLTRVSGDLWFRDLYDALVSMVVYDFNPESMRELQSPDAGRNLIRDGSNIASVIGRLSAESPEVINRITEYLATIVPNIDKIARVPLGHKETLQFIERQGDKDPLRTFHAVNMSDGTLRALGALTAAMQIEMRGRSIALVGIEEPETALHPAAAGALMGALREASKHTQIVVTTHSPDLLDEVDVANEHEKVLVVESRQGTTHITRPDSVSTEAIRTHLYTAGELLRMDQLGLDEPTVRDESQTQYEIPFREEAEERDH